VAYKYSVGKRDFGDIEYEGDVDTQIDFESDFIALTTGGTKVLIVSGSKVGIGTSTPSYELDVAGDIGLSEYIYHKGDDDTFIRFRDDDITIKAGNVSFIKITEDDSQDKISFNEGRTDLDFIVRSPNESLAVYLNAGNEVFHINHGESNFKTKIHSLNGEALTVNDDGAIFNEDGAAANDFRVETDSDTHMLFVDGGNNTVGVATSAPTSGLHVDSSCGYAITGAKSSDYTATASDHTILVNAANASVTITLPTAVGIPGRLYIIKRLDAAVQTVVSIAANGSEEIEASTDDAILGPMGSLVLQSDNSGWWIVGQYSL